MNNVQCNKCGKWFALGGSLYGVAEADGLTVQYFSCPACGEKYHVLTLNDEMRKLIEERKVIQAKIQAAHAKKFREKTIKGYIKELDGIKAKQERLFQELKPLGEAILRPCEAPSEEGSE
jgi:hypothetical protein